jgi:hypothetical protein
MSARERLPDRRTSTTFAFDCGPHRYLATVSAVAKDSAVVSSIALRHGVLVDVIRKALLRDGQGAASSPLGTALDLIAEEVRDVTRRK